MLSDLTGIKFLGEGEWDAKKHGANRHLKTGDSQSLRISDI